MALFNNGYPATYQNPFLYPQPSYQPAQNQQGMIWVQGEAGAKSYMVAPNNTVQLWDSEAQTVYIKSADASGMPSMKILDYKIREASQAAPAVDGRSYATKEEIDGILKQISTLRADVDKMKEAEHE